MIVRRGARVSTNRRLAQAALAVGLAVVIGAAVATGFEGSAWVLRIALVLSAVLLVAVAGFAWREVAQVGAAYAVRSTAISADHRSARERQDRQHARSLAARDAELARSEAVVRRLRESLARAEAAAAARTPAAAPADAPTTVDATGGRELAGVRLLPRHGRVAVRPAQVDPGWDNLEVDVAAR